MKKRLFVFFIVVAMSLAPLFLSVVQAQEATNTQDVDVELSYDSQDPGSKEFFLVAKITSAIDSDRAIVQWVLPSSIIFSEGELNNRTVSLEKGTDVTVKVRVKPVYGSTVANVKVNVTGVKADVSYLGSDSMNLTLNEDFEITPMSKEYKQAKLVKQATTVILVLIMGTALFSGVFFVYIRLRK